MRAVRFHEFGGVDQLRVEDLPEPSPGAGEVKVKVGACALNHLDVDLREGISRFPLELPHVMGLELAGEIVEVGPGVSDRWKVGDRVAPYLMGPDPLRRLLAHRPGEPRAGRLHRLHRCRAASRSTPACRSGT